MKRYVSASTEDDQAYDQFVSDMKSYPGFIEVNKVCQDCGYELSWLLRDKYGVDITIISRGEYHPDIYKSLRRRSAGGSRFVAQTTAYGSLTSEEYEKFRKAVDDTYRLLKWLDSVDLDSLDIINYEEE